MTVQNGNSTALVGLVAGQTNRISASRALPLLRALLLSTAMVTPALATGGGGSGGNGNIGAPAAGLNNPTGVGGNGGSDSDNVNFATTGAAGGGAGTTGGAGGNTGAGTVLGGAGGTAGGPGAAGGNSGTLGVGGAGGGGGSHFFVGASLSGATGGIGGAGGIGGNALGGDAGGGGGGAGAYGAVVTGTGNVGTANGGLIIGGVGGAGGSCDGLCFGGNAGAGGIGILFTGVGAKTATIATGIGGGGGGVRGINTSIAGQFGSHGAGAVGIEGQDLTLNLSGVGGIGVSGGIGGDGVTRAASLNFLGGTNVVNVINSGFLFNGNFQLNNNAALTLTNADPYTLSVAINGSGNVSFNGPGTFTLTQASSYDGGTTINGGSVQLNNLGGLGSGNVFIATSAQSSLRFNASGAFANGINVQDSTANISVAAGQTVTQSGNFGVSGPNGTGILNFGNASDTGTLIVNGDGGGSIGGLSQLAINGGTLRAGTNNGLLSVTGNIASVTVASGGTLDTNDHGDPASFLGIANLLGAGSVITGTNAATVLPIGTGNFSGVISGAGNIRVTDLGTFSNGTLTLSGANTYSGTTTIDADHQLNIGNGGSTGQLGAGAVTNNGTLVFNRTGILINNVISGTGAVTFAGPGGFIFLINGNNTYSGLTTINSGIAVQVGGGGTTGSFGSGAVTNNGSINFFRSGAVTVANAISGTGALSTSGPGTTILTGANTYSGATSVNAGVLQVGNGGTTGALGTGAVTNNGTLAFNRSDAASVANAISGSGALQQLGAGTTTLTGANTYSGVTTISAGTLQIGSGGATGALGTGEVTNNGSLAFNRSDAVTVANAISGSGALSNSGAGTTTLTGANTYAGVTTISAGTLQVGNGGTTGSLGAGAVANNGTLAINRSDAVTVANVISGTGALTKAGAGTTTLTGANTYSGATSIEAGALWVNGSTASSTQTTVNSGATLGGIGTVGRTTISAGGTLSPGNSIGTLTVSGNLVFAPGSTYVVEVSPTAADRTNVTGSAALAGSVSALWGAGSYVARQYTILNATGGVVGTFTGPINTNLPSGFLASLSYDANNAYLNLAAAFSPPSSSNTVNGFNSVSALSRAFAAGTPIPVASGGLTAAGANEIAGQLQVASLGQIIQAQENTTAIGSCRVYDGIVRGGKAAGSAASSSGGDDGRICADGAEGWSVWLGAFAGRQKFDGAAAIGSQDVKGTRNGLSGGAAYSFGATTLGVSVSGGWNNFDLAGVYGEADSTFVQVGVSGFHEIGKAYVQGGVSYGWHDVDTDRTLTIAGVDRLQSSFKARSVGGRAEAGWRFGLDQSVLAPFAAIQIAHANLPTASERVASGSNQFALTYNAKTTSEWRSEVGVKGAKTFALGGAGVLLSGSAAWGHNFDVDRSSTAAFTGVAGSTFTVFGAAPGENLALLSGSARVQLPKGWSIDLGADSELSGGSQVYTGRAALRWRFN